MTWDIGKLCVHNVTRSWQGVCWSAHFVRTARKGARRTHSSRDDASYACMCWTALYESSSPREFANTHTHTHPHTHTHLNDASSCSQVSQSFIPAARHGGWQDGTRCVHSLEDALQVDPPRDLLNQDWGEPFGSQLLVDAEEIDLHRREGPVEHRAPCYSMKTRCTGYDLARNYRESRPDGLQMHRHSPRDPSEN